MFRGPSPSAVGVHEISPVPDLFVEFTSLGAQQPPAWRADLLAVQKAPDPRETTLILVHRSQSDEVLGRKIRV